MLRFVAKLAVSQRLRLERGYMRSAVLNAAFEPRLLGRAQLLAVARLLGVISLGGFRVVLVDVALGGFALAVLDDLVRGCPWGRSRGLVYVQAARKRLA